MIYSFVGALLLIKLSVSSSPSCSCVELRESGLRSGTCERTAFGEPPTDPVPSSLAVLEVNDCGVLKGESFVGEMDLARSRKRLS